MKTHQSPVPLPSLLLAAPLLPAAAEANVDGNGVDILILRVKIMRIRVE